MAKYKLNSIAYRSQTERSRAFRSAAAVRARTRCQRPHRPLPMAETAAWGPCASPAHVRSMAASTVDADLMVTVGDTDVVGEGLRRCCWDRSAALHH